MSPVKKWALITAAAMAVQAALMLGMLLGMQQ